MPDEMIEDSDRPMPIRSRIVAGLVGCVVLLGAAYALLRVSSPPIRPDQPAPGGHYSLQCSWCHARSLNAPRIEVAR